MKANLLILLVLCAVHAATTCSIDMMWRVQNLRRQGKQAARTRARIRKMPNLMVALVGLSPEHKFYAFLDSKPFSFFSDGHNEGHKLA